MCDLEILQLKVAVKIITKSSFEEKAASLVVVFHVILISIFIEPFVSQTCDSGQYTTQQQRAHIDVK